MIKRILSRLTVAASVKQFFKGLLKRLIILASAVVILLGILWIAGIDIMFLQKKVDRELAPIGQAPQVNNNVPLEDQLPKDSDFVQVAETSVLILKADPNTGHFLVEDKRNGSIHRSYPDPEHWPNEGQSGLWRNHLRSPMMFQFIDLNVRNVQTSTTNMINAGGSVTNFERIPNGFRLVFDVPYRQFKFPVEVTLEDDFVQTKLISDGIEEGRFTLMFARLYPFFGAVHSVGQQGYLVIPDGSGTTIPFIQNRPTSNRMYEEFIYGRDSSYNVTRARDNDAIMPILGIKSGNKAVLAVIHEGAEYSKVLAAPSNVFSAYNWGTFEHVYRLAYTQYRNVSRQSGGFTSYDHDVRFEGDRTIRYFIIDDSNPTYAGMANRYRQYLMEEKGMTRIEPSGDKIPMHITLLGGDQEPGFLSDRYVTATTTSQAMQIVQRFYGLGIENMVVRYTGWQKGGVSSLGTMFPVESKIGGQKGMDQFIEFAGQFNIPVYLQAEYSINNTGKNFNRRYHGVRNKAGTIISFDFFRRGGRPETLVSAPYMETLLNADLNKYVNMGAAGLSFSGTGRFTETDFNDRYGGARLDNIGVAKRVFDTVRDTLGGVFGERSHFFVIDNVDHIYRLYDDYSYDLFSSNSIPFAQMSIHGLVTYTGAAINERDQFRNDFLRSVEFGSLPSFIFTDVDAQSLRYTHDSNWLFNPDYRDWEEIAVQEYQRFNNALANVQGLFMVDHRTLAPDVRETTYENGKRIIVNYGITPYRNGSIFVPAQDFIVIEGGGTR